MLESKDFVLITVSSLAVLLSFAMAVTSRLIRNFPTTATIAVLGLPGSGKTTFLATLLDSAIRARELSALPGDSTTPELVGKIMRDLWSRKWPEKTDPTRVVIEYRISVTVDRAMAYLGLNRLLLPLFRPLQFRITIGDFAGEYTSDLGRSGDNLLEKTEGGWLHANEFFKYCVQADAVMLMIDVTDVRVHGASLIQTYITALEVLSVEKSGRRSSKIVSPVAIILTKCDTVIPDSGDDRYFFDFASFPPRRQVSILREFAPELNCLDRLINHVEALCENSMMFVVSSVGRVDHHGVPVLPIRPANVLAPFKWIVRMLPSTLRQDFVESNSIRISLSSEKVIRHDGT